MDRAQDKGIFFEREIHVRWPLWYILEYVLNWVQNVSHLTCCGSQHELAHSLALLPARGSEIEEGSGPALPLFWIPPTSRQWGKMRG